MLTTSNWLVTKIGIVQIDMRTLVEAALQNGVGQIWGAVKEVPDRNGGSYRLPGRSWRFSGEKLDPLGEPAFQGEHNREVFAELGLSDAEIDRYVASGALVSASLPKAVIANKRQLVSSSVTDTRPHMEHET